MLRISPKSLFLFAPVVLMGLGGCTRDYKFQPVDMWNMSRLKPYEQVNFFDNRSVQRLPPQGTIARSQERADEQLYFGTRNGTLISTNPVFDGASPKDKMAILQRGQERYNIYCQPCHGLNGSADGMIVKRGFAKPPSYHIERLRTVGDGHLYDVIKNGYGSMYSYSARVPTRDRWAIVAYIRALQLSQNAKTSDFPKGVDPKKAQILPPLEDPEMKYQGPGAGREYHNSGPGGAGNPGSNGLGEEHGTMKNSEDVHAGGPHTEGAH